MEPIDETLKKIAGGILKGSSPTILSTDGGEGESARPTSLPGDPNCPICAGVGFVRKDVPVGHPDFGRVDICSCREKEVIQQTYQRLYRLSNLEAFRKMTFESFKTEGLVGMSDEEVHSLKMAIGSAKYYAQTLKGWLLLHGKYGVGKTHLSAAIANFAVGLGVPTLFLTVPDLLDWLRFAYGSDEENFETRFEEIRSINLLVLDDLGTQNATPWAEEKLYQIFNARYTNRLPTVVTTNQALDEIEGRIQSRLRDPELVTKVEIKAPDYRDPAGSSNQRELSSLDLYRDKTFGSFSMREPEKLSVEERQSLVKGFQAAQSYAENPRGWMVLMGTYGCGKTHLAAAIANYRAGMEQAPLFVVAPDLLDHLRSTYGPNSTVSFDVVFEQVRSAPMLILDDLGTQSATPWAREKLYQILNHRYVANLPTVITTADKIEDVDPRIRSRMLDARRCSIYAIMTPAYRGTGAPVEKTRRSRMAR